MPRRRAAPRPAAPPVSNTRLAMVVVIAGESMLFAGLIGSYLVFRLAAPAWPPPDQPRLPLGMMALNTLVLLGSVVPMARALAAARRGHRRTLRHALTLTALAGLFFLATWFAWVARGGLDPAEYVARLDDRLFAVHAKDNAPQGTAEEEGGFATLGQGVLDWETILPAIDRAGVEWYIIEHDRPLDAEAVITEGNRFLRDELSVPGDE